MRRQCNSKAREFEGHGRRRLVAKKLIFLLVFFVSLRGYFCPSCSFADAVYNSASGGTIGNPGGLVVSSPGSIGMPGSPACLA